jgi:NitT/TauT family transport system substrate-binding protein
MSLLTRRRYLFHVGTFVLLMLPGGCRSESTAPTTLRATSKSEGLQDANADLHSKNELATLRLGYFPNITHATAVVGIETGRFEQALQGTAKLEVSTFNAGPAAVEALLSGALDISFIGPNPALNAYLKSKGKGIRLIAGATSGGAALIVQQEVNTFEDLRGKNVASPQIGGTQDIALRTWLRQKGLTTDPFGGGDVHILPQENAQSLESFRAKSIVGAWVPEPWATRLVIEGQGKMLVDERTLWPNGKFAATVVAVRTEYLQEHPDIVRRFLAAHVATTKWIYDHPQESRESIASAIKKITGKTMTLGLIEQALNNLNLAVEPLPEAVKKVASDAEQLHLLQSDGISLEQLWDLSLLQDLERSVTLARTSP